MDFCDYIQKNGQTLAALENCYSHDEGEPDVATQDVIDEFNECIESGSDEAIIVMIPNDISLKEIKTWPLAKFSEFPVLKTQYDPEEWEFQAVEGYRQVLLESEDASVWSSFSRPGFHLINFEPGAYQAFVKGESKPDDIPWDYYYLILGDEILTRNKEQCYEFVRGQH